jgi:imidazolonepropionase-like amidohydrolase
MQAMKFPGAPHGLKMACGENPKRVYGGKGKAPSTRMGNVAGYRQAFADAQDYRRQFDRYQKELAAYEAQQSGEGRQRKGATPLRPPVPPKRDLRLETLVGAMDGDIQVHIHCYRADEMAVMLDLAREFGFKVAAFHHGTEAYKIADRLAAEGVCGALWADWWGFKMEAYDGIWENLAFVDAPANGCAIVHSDSAEGIQRLNQEAAKAMARGQGAGLDIPPERAIRWVTSNAARSLGIEREVGTLEPGKRADVVIWNRDPFSVYALADRVYLDGALAYDRAAPPGPPDSDFLLGQPVGGAK